MNEMCALYRQEKVGDKDYWSIREYCDGLEDRMCLNGGECPFFKSIENWKPVVIRKQTQYVRI